jgi:uncharacterized protein
MDGDTYGNTTSLRRWQDRERPALPPSRDQHLITGFDGESYFFDAQSGLFVALLGPAQMLIEALLADKEKSAALLDALAQQYPRKDILEAMEQCTSVLAVLQSQVTAAPAPENARPGYNLSLNAGMACNLACSYCDPVGYREKTRGQVMSEETARQALGFFFDRLPEGAFGNVTYSIGGEPLLYRRLLVFVQEYLQTLRAQGVPAGQYLNTNGLLLSDGTIEYLRVNAIPFGISLDGPPEANDAHRLSRDGGGTYEHVLPAVEKVLAQFPHTTVSAVITATFPRPLEIYRHLLELGFHRIIVKPVRGRPDQEFAFTPDNLHLLQDGYREYARYFADELAAGRHEIYAAINPHDYFARFLLRLLRRQKMTYRCGASSMANLTVAPDGSFYPCEGFVGHTEYRLGDVTAGFDEAQMARFASLYVDERPVCRDCWARYQCGGGCYLQGAMVNNDIAAFDPAECELTRFLVGLAITTLGHIETRRPDAIAELHAWCDTKGWGGWEVREPASNPGLLELPMV